MLQQTANLATLSEYASPLNSARSTQSARAAARRVGMTAYGAQIARDKRAALASLAKKEAEEHKQTLADIDTFDDRLDACLRARPMLADSGRRSLPWKHPSKAADDEAAMEARDGGVVHTRAPPPAKPLKSALRRPTT